MSVLTILPAVHRVTRAWKNGGGSTTDVMVAPEGSDLDGFQWRISIAAIDRDGPFSEFPGIDRTLTILSGEGIFLDIGGRLQKLTQRSMPFRFSGDARATARLLDGGVQDLNVMSRRGLVDHRVLRLGGGEGRAAEIAAPVAIMIWAGEAGEAMTPAGPVRLQSWDGVHCTQPGRWQIPPSALAYLVSLGPTG